jgi:hypothetical protein
VEEGAGETWAGLSRLRLQQRHRLGDVGVTKALAYAVFGARGTGKGAWVRRQIDRVIKPPRLLVFDFKNDPGPSMEGVGLPVYSLADLARMAQAPRFRLRYIVNHAGPLSPVEQFEFFCEIAWRAGNLLMWVDELPEVTSARKPPPIWRRCVNVGRDYRIGTERKWLSIIGSGQRMREVDKAFIANCDVVHTGRLGYASEAQELAGAWGCDYRTLMQLPDLHFVEKRADRAELVRGVLTFDHKPTPAAKKTPARKRGP